MRTARLLAAAGIAAATVGCAANTDTAAGTAEPAASSSTTGSVTPSPGPVGNTGKAPASASGGTRSGQPSPPLNGGKVTLGPTDGDRRGDLVRGARTLTGTVYREADWVLLNVAGARWALLGETVRTLRTGQTVTATGTVTPPPPGCPATMALAVSRLS